MSDSRLEARHVSKTFGSTRVLDDVEITVAPGEIHALIGQSGSGKSTVVKILTGYHVPDPGMTLALDGQLVELPVQWAAAQAAGVTVVHQDLGLIDHMSVAENIGVGGFVRSKVLRRIDWKKQHEIAAAVLSRLQVDVDLEFGLQSRTGRTLELTGSVAAEVYLGAPRRAAILGRRSVDKADSTQLPLTGVSDAALARWVRGVVERVRTRGGIHHDWLRPYIEKNANRYHIWTGRPRGQGRDQGENEDQARAHRAGRRLGVRHRTRMSAEVAIRPSSSRLPAAASPQCTDTGASSWARAAAKAESRSASTASRAPSARCRAYRVWSGVTEKRS